MAFNRDRVVEREVTRIIKRFEIRFAVETGTHEGVTAEFLSDLVERVFTVEVKPEYFYYSAGRLHSRKNISLIGGDSAKALEKVLEDIPPNELVLFYLDAHSAGLSYWPLLDELEIIGKKRFNNAIVIIDDFKVPNRSFMFDTFDGKENCLAFIGEKARGLAPEVVFYFNDKSDLPHPDLGTNGKIYIFPRRLETELSDFVEKQGDYFYSNLKKHEMRSPWA